MKKIIGKKEYDTEKAAILQRFRYGYWGDPAGYEELLYETEDGLYFVHVRGGEDSPYPQEDIQRIAKNKLKEWLSERQ